MWIRINDKLVTGKSFEVKKTVSKEDLREIEDAYKRIMHRAYDYGSIHSAKKMADKMKEDSLKNKEYLYILLCDGNEIAYYDSYVDAKEVLSTIQEAIETDVKVVTIIRKEN